MNEQVYSFPSVTLTHLIDGKPNGEELEPLVTLHPASFLHQRHDHRADHLPVLRVVVLLVQLELILRIRPKRVLQKQFYKKWSWVYFLQVVKKGEGPTWEVPAAAGRAASHPAALVD